MPKTYKINTISRTIKQSKYNFPVPFNHTKISIKIYQKQI